MNWIKRFRKLNIKVQVAVLCVICLVASLGLNVFRHKSMTVSAGELKPARSMASQVDDL